MVRPTPVLPRSISEWPTGVKRNRDGETGQLSCRFTRPWTVLTYLVVLQVPETFFTLVTLNI